MMGPHHIELIFSQIVTMVLLCLTGHKTDLNPIEYLCSVVTNKMKKTTLDSTDDLKATVEATST